MELKQCDEDCQHEAFLSGKELFSNIGMHVENPPEKLFTLLCPASNPKKQVPNLVPLLVDALSVLSLAVENELLLQMVAIQKDVLVWVGPAVEDRNPVLQGEVGLEAAAEVDHFRYAVYDHVLLWLET